MKPKELKKRDETERIKKRTGDVVRGRSGGCCRSGRIPRRHSTASHTGGKLKRERGEWERHGFASRLNSLFDREEKNESPSFQACFSLVFFKSVSLDLRVCCAMGGHDVSECC